MELTPQKENQNPEKTEGLSNIEKVKLEKISIEELNGLKEDMLASFEKKLDEHKLKGILTVLHKKDITFLLLSESKIGKVLSKILG